MATQKINVPYLIINETAADIFNKNGMKCFVADAIGVRLKDHYDLIDDREYLDTVYDLAIRLEQKLAADQRISHIADLLDPVKNKVISMEDIAVLGSRTLMKGEMQPAALFGHMRMPMLFMVVPEVWNTSKYDNILIEFKLGTAVHFSILSVKRIKQMPVNEHKIDTKSLKAMLKSIPRAVSDKIAKIKYRKNNEFSFSLIAFQSAGDKMEIISYGLGFILDETTTSTEWITDEHFYLDTFSETLLRENFDWK